MDPNATLAEWRQARKGWPCKENDRIIRGARNTLVAWLKSGGFWPSDIAEWEAQVLEDLGAPKRN